MKQAGNKEIFTKNTVELVEILNWFDWSGAKPCDFEVIDERYKFHGVDHDNWEFEAIVKRKSDSKYFSVIWCDSYSCSMNERFGDNELWDFIEVFPKVIETIIYE